MSGPRLTVVVPCFNEEARVGRSLERLDAWLRAHIDGGYEILAVNDGSTDRTADILDAMAAQSESIRPIHLRPNHGKGYAVRAGMLAGEGALRIFTDADLATPPDEFGPLMAALESAPVAIGTRVHPDGTDMRSASQTAARRFLGRLFTRVARPLVGPGIPDTQCGFKGFRAAAAETIFSRLKTEGYVFDIEVLCLARRAGLQVVQVPVRWRDPGGSRVEVRVRLMLRTLVELARVWWRLRQG